MAEALSNNELHDEKMYLVQRLLTEGKTKFQTARAVGYSGVDGLDRYAKGKGYTWNVITKNYELKDGIETIENPSERIIKVISMVEKGIELNDIAKYFRMKSSEELANYMKLKGYVWDVEQGNYIKKNVVINENDEIDSNKGEFGQVHDEHSNGVENDVDIVKFLEANRNKLIELLSNKPQNTIPRYLLKGMAVTKGFFISVEIDRLIKEFSREKNIMQKDIVQIALIDFFQKYGFEHEVNAVLKC